MIDTRPLELQPSCPAHFSFIGQHLPLKVGDFQLSVLLLKLLMNRKLLEFVFLSSIIPKVIAICPSTFTTYILFKMEMSNLGVGVIGPSKRRVNCPGSGMSPPDLASFFECPVCFDYVLPPIIQCSAGHLVCSNCRPKLTCCPTCRGPLGNV